MGQTVNLLALAFGGSNPSPPTRMRGLRHGATPALFLATAPAVRHRQPGLWALWCGVAVWGGCRAARKYIHAGNVREAFVGPTNRQRNGREAFVGPTKRPRNVREAFVGPTKGQRKGRETFVGATKGQRNVREAFVGATKGQRKGRETFVGATKRQRHGLEASLWLTVISVGGGLCPLQTGRSSHSNWP